jgi:hypothetical protein
MSLGSGFLTSVMLGIIFTMMLQPSNGQFPTACMDDTSLQTQTCCPNNCGGGSRGACTNISIPVLTEFSNTAVRDNWPHYYTNVCRCNGNYAGFDCSRCKYGYYGSDCNQKMELVPPRRPISELSSGEWSEYLNTLIMSRSHPSGYFVFLEEPSRPNQNIMALRKTTVNSLYDLFIWQHHYAAKNNNDNPKSACKLTGLVYGVSL